MSKLPGGERCTLIAGPGFVDPDMDGMVAAVMRQIDRGGRGTPIDGCQPAGIAMGQHVDGFALLLFRRDCLDHRDSVPGNALVDDDVFFGNLGRARIGGHSSIRR